MTRGRSLLEADTKNKRCQKILYAKAQMHAKSQIILNIPLVEL